ncbi:hypothetical protein CMI45_00345 [Candidatus Pacearchaeota archaeon]|jgi:hypothetical protein|nr:hypothetical protein [Candidatus Pacearchaeota archaeon]|tara:strand:+ start:1852 stop:2379 length:528 start_codon:yes stop_codon:yes gene_type:complete
MKKRRKLDWIDRTLYSILIGASTLLPLSGMFVKSAFLSEKINSQSQLERVIDEEKEKLGLGSVEVEGKLVDKGFQYEGRDATKGIAAWAVKDWDDQYKIFLINGRGNTRDGVRHELYHLARGMEEPTGKGSNKSTFNNWEADYLLSEEPQAVIYAATGLKLGKLNLSNYLEKNRN